MKQYKYSIRELAGRLVKIAIPEMKYIVQGTLASIVGNLAHMGIMGFGASLILFCAGRLESGSAPLWGGLTLLCALCIAVMRFYEGYASHVAAYHLLANMRVHFFQSLRKLAPACLVDRQKGDIISIAISDVETIEHFFAHTIGPMFTVILLPLTALCYAGSVHWLFAAGLFPVYIMISVVIPLLAMKSGRDMGARYRKDIGLLKSGVLESVYGLKDIQIFGISEKRIQDVERQSRIINKTAHAMTLHRQLVTAMPTFFIYLSRILIVFIASYVALTEQVDFNRVIILSFIVSASFSSTQSLISVVSSLLETFAAAERFFEIEDEIPAVTEKADVVSVDHIHNLKFENLYFNYREQKEPILRNINLSIPKGSKVGIVG